jgi:hypothetical protein
MRQTNMSNRIGQPSQKNMRLQSGSGIAEAVAGLCIIAAIVVLSTQLLVNIAIASYYKDKIGVVTNCAAGYAASICSWNYSSTANITDPILSARITGVVKSALRQMNFPSGQDVTVTAQKNADDTVRVTLEVRNLKLSGKGNIFPLTITMTDSAVATLNNDKPPMLLQMGTAGYAASPIGVVPAYGIWNPNDSNNVLAHLGSYTRMTRLGWHVNSYSDSLGTRVPERHWTWGDGWVTE